MANSEDGRAVVRRFREQGLTIQLAPDGSRFTLTGLSALDAEVREAVSQRAREQKPAIVAALREEAARDLRLETSPPELWPLRCHYTAVTSIGHVLATHRIELNCVGEDFQLQNPQRVTREMLPDLCFFFRHNGGLINEWLRGGHEPE